MPSENLLGPWVRRYLAEHLVTERNLASNTQLSYRDTLALLLPFLSALARRRPALRPGRFGRARAPVPAAPRAGARSMALTECVECRSGGLGA